MKTFYAVYKIIIGNEFIDIPLQWHIKLLEDVYTAL